MEYPVSFYVMKKLSELITQEVIKLLLNYRCGLEREALRIDFNGVLNTKPHPTVLGSSLTHPYITTDFAEAQLEFITPPKRSFLQTEKDLNRLEGYAVSQLTDELLWPLSVPCILPKTDIRLAHYGTSTLAKKKHLYRQGLAFRYGPHMQMHSGIHYNFSFSHKLWKYLNPKIKTQKELYMYMSASYLHIIRNFLRYGWLLSYLFGSSPVLDRSYQCKECDCIREYATSLRMSPLGYYSRIQAQLSISFNHLDEYLADLEYAISIPRKEYKQEKRQLNDHILQSEWEHYCRIRPKNTPKQGESLLQAIKNRGIHYLEVRSIDINPFIPVGIDQEAMLFLHLFLIYCLFRESPPLDSHSQNELTENQNKTALFGRDPSLQLSQNQKQVPLNSWASSILNEIKPIASLLDFVRNTPHYLSNLKAQQAKLIDPNLIPSAQIVAALKRESLISFGLKQAHAHKKAFLKDPLSSKILNQFKHMAQESLKEQDDIESQGI